MAAMNGVKMTDMGTGTIAQCNTEKDKDLNICVCFAMLQEARKESNRLDTTVVKLPPLLPSDLVMGNIKIEFYSSH